MCALSAQKRTKSDRLASRGQASEGATMKNEPMTSLPPTRFRRAFFVSAFSVATLLHWPLRALDLDFHHDGYMTAVAVAVAEGKTPHTDLFMPYGPVFTALQALVVRIGGDSVVLSLRTMSVLIIAIVAGLLATAGASCSKSAWPIPPAAGPISAAVWILLSDALTWVPILPWVSLWVTATTLVVLNLVRISYETVSMRMRYWALVGAGIATTSLLMSRPAIGLAALALVALGATRGDFRRALGPFLWSLVVSVVGLAAVVVLSEWGTRFFWQVYVFPVERFLIGGPAQSSTVTLYLTGTQLLPELAAVATLALRGRIQLTAEQRMLVLAALALIKTASLETLLPQVISVAVVVGLLALAETHRLRRGSGPAPNAVSGFLAGWILVVLPVVGGGVELRALPLNGMAFDPFSQAFASLSTNTLYLALISGLLVSAVMFASSFLLGELSKEATGKLLIASFSLASAGEVLSIPDTRHVWWALPPSLILLVSMVGHDRLRYVRPRQALAVAALFLSFMIPAVTSAFLYANLSRVVLEDGIGRGMLVNRDVEGHYTEMLHLVRQLGDDPPAMYVGDLLIAVIDGHYVDAPVIIEWSPWDFVDLLDSPRILIGTSLVDKPHVALGLSASRFAIEYQQGDYTVFHR